MTLRSVMVQLKVEQVEKLDREADRTGVSRSQLVRDAVASFLHPPTDEIFEEAMSVAINC